MTLNTAISPVSPSQTSPYKFSFLNLVWAKIASGVKKFIKGFIESLLTEEVTDRIGAGRCVKRFSEWQARWQVEEEPAVRSWKRTSSTAFIILPLIRPSGSPLGRPTFWNGFREVRRHTRPLNNFFTKEASSNRIMYGITEMLNKTWRAETVKQISTI